MIGENLAAWLELQNIPVFRAAHNVWWEATPGALEPLAPIAAGLQAGFGIERYDVDLLLRFTGKRAARYPSSEGEGTPLPWSVWRRNESCCAVTADVAPLTGWQLRSTGAARYAELVTHHAAWHAVGRFVDQDTIDAYLITCEDSGWIHEVENSHPGDPRGEELCRYWQTQIRHHEEWLGLIHRPARHERANTNLRWSSVERGGRGILRALRALAS